MMMMMLGLLVLLVFLSIFAQSYALKISPPKFLQHYSSSPSISWKINHTLFAAAGSELDEVVKQRIDSLVRSNKVLLFMKGNKLFPQCGFSNTACRILDALNTPFETVNVLEDEGIRSGIKIYSSWPTIPQLYVGGEFVGGSDIMIELYNSGDLAEMIELANAN